MFLMLVLLTALAMAWIAHGVERRATRGREHLSDHERTRRDRNHLKGYPWQYDVSAGRSGRLVKE